MKKVSTSFMVKSEDLNHHGTLFAGRGMYYFIQAGFITAANTFKNTAEIVCYAVNDFRFFKPVKNGQILEFSGIVVDVGRTSITVYVRGFCPLIGEENMEGFITFVTVDEKKRTKKPHHLLLDSPEDEVEIKLRQKALRILGK